MCAHNNRRVLSRAGHLTKKTTPLSSLVLFSHHHQHYNYDYYLRCRLREGRKEEEEEEKRRVVYVLWLCVRACVPIVLGHEWMQTMGDLAWDFYVVVGF